MRIGQAFAAEIWHWVGLAPHHVVQNPEPLVLQLSAHTEHVVIAANHPDRTIRFQKATRGRQPRFGEIVVNLKAFELVPIIVDGIDLGIVRAVKITTQLKIIRRVSKDQVNTALGQAVHDVDAITIKDTISRQCGCICLQHFLCHTSPLSRRIVPLVC